MKKRELKYVDPKILKKYKKNSRLHSNEQVEQIIDSIKEWGFTNPLLIDEDNTIIAGHGRLAASLKMKLKEVPVIIMEGLTDLQKRAYLIADNKLALNASWDENMLEQEVRALFEKDFDVSLLGFSDVEIDEMLNEYGQNYIQEDEVGAIPQAIQLTPPREYVLIMCNESNDEWEELKVALNLTPVRKGGYKKGSAFDAIGTQRVIKAEDFLNEYTRNKQ